MGKIGMSVLVKGLAMDFERQGRHDMAINAIWPAAVCETLLFESEPPTKHNIGHRFSSNQGSLYP